MLIKRPCIDNTILSALSPALGSIVLSAIVTANCCKRRWTVVIINNLHGRAVDSSRRDETAYTLPVSVKFTSGSIIPLLWGDPAAQTEDSGIALSIKSADRLFLHSLLPKSSKISEVMFCFTTARQLLHDRPRPSLDPSRRTPVSQNRSGIAIHLESHKNLNRKSPTSCGPLQQLATGGWASK